MIVNGRLKLFFSGRTARCAAYLPQGKFYGRGCGVGRGLGVGEHLSVHGVGLGVAVGEGVGPDCAQYLPPVLLTALP